TPASSAAWTRSPATTSSWRNSIGFALTVLQRRLASSPEAILRSLERRRDRLTDLLRRIDANEGTVEELLGDQQKSLPSVDDTSFDDVWDETPEGEQQSLENDVDQVVDSATAAKSRQELAAEIELLGRLVEEASQVRNSGADAKWSELSAIVQKQVLDTGTSPLPHKMIVFTEHRDTLTYLEHRIASLTGRRESVVTIHGGLSRDERRARQERFSNDPSARILVATDAAGEGLNLQRADLMVNYDLPWNPNRIEQRFGRIHRIGQKRVCFLWNMVARGTREGDVYRRLLDKIETIGRAYRGNLFNVLGDGKAFHGKPLKDLMVQAIRYGDRPDVQAQLEKTIDSSVSDGLDDLLNERSAHPEMYPRLDVDEVRRMMERNRERKLQPGFVSAFFLAAFDRLGGSARRRETGRWELTHVPSEVRRRALRIDRHHPLAAAYERVTFDPERIHAENAPDAMLIALGTPLLGAVTDLVIERFGLALDRGTVFVDRTDTQPDAPMLLMAVEQTIDDVKDRPISRHFDYLEAREGEGPVFSPAPPYLDYEAPRPEEHAAVSAVLRQPWLKRNDMDALRGFAYQTGTRPVMESLKSQRHRHAQQVRMQVEARLNAEIRFWYDQYNRLLDDRRQGRKPGKRTPTGAKRMAQTLETRLENREKELAQEDMIHARPAVVRGMALVIPDHVLHPETQQTEEARMHARQTEEVDRRAVALTMAAERALGRHPTEMPHNNKGYDIDSRDDLGNRILIEVKGRIDLPGADTFTVSANEVATGQSQEEHGHHRLSLVRVSPDGPEHDRIRYVGHAFDHLAVSPTTTSFNEDFASYWNRGREPW
uniref:helicase-related protein n=1 Tax=uncultured Bifidobacterium sp. TaxID=165187 RepID=UPI0028DB6E4A